MSQPVAPSHPPSLEKRAEHNETPSHRYNRTTSALGKAYDSQGGQGLVYVLEALNRPDCSGMMSTKVKQLPVWKYSSLHVRILECACSTQNNTIYLVRTYVYSQPYLGSRVAYNLMPQPHHSGPT